MGTWAVALTTSSDYVTWSPWSVAPVATSSAAAAPQHIIGVAQIAVTDGYYFWAQTWGPGVAAGDDSETNISTGWRVITSTAAAGKVMGGGVLGTATWNMTLENQLFRPQVGIGVTDSGGGDALVPLFITICR